MKRHYADRNKRNSLLSRRLVSGALMLAMLMTFGQAVAQNAPVQPAKNEQAQPAKNLNEYFRGKYFFHPTGHVRSSIRQTQYGPNGRLTLMGVDIRFESVSGMTGKHGIARAIAAAFLLEEASVLGITDMKELREVNLATDEQYDTYISYRRFINGIELADMFINLTIGPNNEIRSCRATLIPVAPEVYSATTKQTLSEEQIRKIVRQDLKSFPRTGPKPDLSRAKFKKYATADAPYVIWDVIAGRHYRIDAFTGEILQKSERRTIDP